MTKLKFYDYSGKFIRDIHSNTVPTVGSDIYIDDKLYYVVKIRYRVTQTILVVEIHLE